MTQRIKITLELPPYKLSPNARTHWRERSKLVQNYRDEARQEAMAAAHEQGIDSPFALPVVHIAYFNKRDVKPDGDNILASLKSAFDGFSDAGIWSDDRLCFYFPIQREQDKDSPRVEVTIYEDLPPDYDEILRDYEVSPLVPPFAKNSMPSFNQVTVVGNITRDIDLRYTQGGTAVTEIGIAINERVKRGEEWVDEAVFVDATLWGRLAENASEYLEKGSPVLVSGRLKLDQWEQNGQKRSKLGIVADKVQFLGGNNGSGSRGGGRSQGHQQNQPGPQGRPEGHNAYGSSQGQQPTSYNDPDIPF